MTKKIRKEIKCRESYIRLFLPGSGAWTFEQVTRSE